MGAVFEAIKNRRSIRSFSEQPVSHGDILKLVEASSWAPSGKNGQPWKFAVIFEDVELKNKIAMLTIYHNWVKKAPCLITIFLD